MSLFGEALMRRGRTSKYMSLNEMYTTYPPAQLKESSNMKGPAT
jgi:hypothetical protein